MKEEKIIEEKKYTINIFYLDSKLIDYKFPYALKDFKKDIISIFNFSSNITEQLIYKLKELNNEEKILDFKSEESYKKEISYIKSMNENMNINIYIENKNNNNDNNFEENIKLIVEKKKKNAADRIINKFKYQGKKLSEIKIRDKRCQLCNQIIEGNLYKTIFDDNELFYCENCSIDVKEPLFIFV